jgi:class 3 adenylate cyclase
MARSWPSCQARVVSEVSDAGWARSGELYIAYEVRGAGAIDLVQVPGILNTITASRYHRPVARFEDELGRFSRLIKLDKRGTGLSDRLPAGAVPTVEERIDDVRAVMDAVASDRACLYGTADGGPIAIVFAATYPERVSSLVLSATGPVMRIGRTADDPSFEEYFARVAREWGHGFLAGAFKTHTDEQRPEIAQLERLAGTPPVVAALMRALLATDVRATLPAVSVPTLVIHYQEHPVWPIEGARLLAERIPNARIIELQGAPEGVAGSRASADLARIIQKFATGQHADPEPDRVLKTILFTDIVESTEHAVRLGDRRWRALLEEHDAAIRVALERFRGQEIKTTGDGFFAAFDGPARAIRCARVIAEDGHRLGIEVRAGIHTGECELHGDDLAGIAVHIGSRVAARAAPGEVLVTGTVRDLVAGSGIEFDDRGRHTLKGIPGDWPILAVCAD